MNYSSVQKHGFRVGDAVSHVSATNWYGDVARVDFNGCWVKWKFDPSYSIFHRFEDLEMVESKFQTILKSLSEYVGGDHAHVGVLTPEQRDELIEMLLGPERERAVEGDVGDEFVQFLEDGYIGYVNMRDGALLDEVATSFKSRDLPDWLLSKVLDQGWRVDDDGDFVMSKGEQ